MNQISEKDLIIGDYYKDLIVPSKTNPYIFPTDGDSKIDISSTKTYQINFDSNAEFINKNRLTINFHFH